MTDEFKEFDRALENLRDDVAVANLTMSGIVRRYINMMDALDTAFLLYYPDMSSARKTEMKERFNKLADAVRTVLTDDESQS